MICDECQSVSACQKLGCRPADLCAARGCIPVSDWHAIEQARKRQWRDYLVALRDARDSFRRSLRHCAAKREERARRDPLPF